MSSPRILVAGATGNLGRAIVEQAAARGHRVRALGRSASALGELAGTEQRIAMDLLQGETRQLDEALVGVDAVISTVGGSISPDFGKGRRGFLQLDVPANQRLIEAAERAGVRRFVYIAVAGHTELLHLNYVRAHEEVVAALRRSGLETCVLRATGFFSAFESVLELASKGKVPLLGNPEARTNPIADSDLAALAVAQLSAPPGERTVGGPQILTRQAIAELAFEALGREPRFTRLPDWIVRMLGALIWPVSPRVSELTRFFLEISSRDCLGEPVGEARLGEHFERKLLGRRGEPLRLEN